MAEIFPNRPTWAEINLENLAFNFKEVKKFIDEDIEYMAVVKADAYGHGAGECAKKLESAGIDWFGVALPEEGVELRENGVSKPILCLGSFWKGQEKLLFDNNLTPVIYRIDLAKTLDEFAESIKQIINIHIKVDTGMGRIGIRFDEIADFISELKNFKNLRTEGIMTHLAAADDLSENEFTSGQIEKFNCAVKMFENAGFSFKYKDVANSPGAIAHAQSRKNLVRLGGILYGLGDDVLPKEIDKPLLKPVMSVYSRIAHIKNVPKNETVGYSRTFKLKSDSMIATVPIGYQDGYARSLSNRANAIIRGEFVPVVGRVSMDWTLLDVSKIENVKVGDEVILIGEQAGKTVSAEDLAKIAKTISYEITCGISRRVVRRYVGS